MAASIKHMAIAAMIAAFPMAMVAEAPVSGVSSAEQASDLEIMAVEIYADWCPSCQALDPKWNAAITSNDWDGISFAKIDFTRRNRKAFFAEAEALGVGEVFKDLFSNGIKTGMVLLIDIRRQTVLDILTQADSVADIEARLEIAQGHS
jgi:thiol:disulfide interchange protein